MPPEATSPTVHYGGPTGGVYDVGWQIYSQSNGVINEVLNNLPQVPTPTPGMHPSTVEANALINQTSDDLQIILDPNTPKWKLDEINRRNERETIRLQGKLAAGQVQMTADGIRRSVLDQKRRLMSREQFHQQYNDFNAQNASRR